jgi:hypothetical protein
VPPENLEKIAELLRPMQEDAAKMSEEEVNSAIDEAVSAVRRERAAKRHKQIQCLI